MIKKIEMFETEDGEQFEDEQDAIDHEKECELKEKLRKLINDHPELISNEEDALNFLMENKEEIKRLLNE